jgi:hypothetical protein
MSKLRKLRHLSLAQSFEGCTHYGLDAALATMTGAIPRWSCFLSSCLMIVALQASHRLLGSCHVSLWPGDHY